MLFLKFRGYGGFFLPKGGFVDNLFFTEKARELMRFKSTSLISKC